jgi:hypothetical protein
VIQRRAVAGIVLAVSTSLVGACGFEAPDVTTHEHNSIQAADFSVGAVRVRAVAVTSLQTSATTATSYLMVTFVNDGTTGDTLTGVRSPLGPITLSGDGVLDGALLLPPGVPVEIDQPLLSPGGPTATFAATTAPAEGSFVPLSFSFRRAGSSPTEQVPVVPSTETTAPTMPVPDATASVPQPTGEPASD